MNSATNGAMMALPEVASDCGPLARYPNEDDEKETKHTYADNKEKLCDDEAKQPSEAFDFTEERFRVDRKILEQLLQGEQNVDVSEGNFFDRIGKATNTTITWPAKLKLGAKSKKDPHIKVAGLPDDIQAAKQMVLSVMDTKMTRVTLKMDVSFADHSHIIGKGGNTIKKVMHDTNSHIHFPDSNRTSSEKSNQVSIAGPPFGVESARRQIRELLPILLVFEIPTSPALVPDASSPVIQNIAHAHGVNITFKPRPRSYGFIGTVRGLHSDPFAIRDAVRSVLEHLTGTMPVTVPVTTQLEVDPKHHQFLAGQQLYNIKQITQATGASIMFPDPLNPNVRKSTITITGSIESAVAAKVHLLELLPLTLMFDVRDGDSDLLLEEGTAACLMEKLDVQISIKPKPRQGCKSVIVKGHEKNARNIYLSRLHLIGDDPSSMPYLSSTLPTLIIPNPSVPLQLVSPLTAPVAHPVSAVPAFQPHYAHSCRQEDITSNGQALGSPPVKSSSPLTLPASMGSSNHVEQNGYSSDPVRIQSSSHASGTSLRCSPVGQRIIGSERKMKKLSFDTMLVNNKSGSATTSADEDRLSSSADGGRQAETDLLGSKSTESIGESLGTRHQSDSIGNNADAQLARVSSGNWGSRHYLQPPVDLNCNSVNGSSLGDSGIYHSQDDLSMSSSLSMTKNLINNLALQNPKISVGDYEFRRKLASRAMQSSLSPGVVRTPTDAWSGYGFSNSMPEAAIKELWNERNSRSQAISKLREGLSPNASLNSSSSSGTSASSFHSHGADRQSPPQATVTCRPPPGLEDSQPSLENPLMFRDRSYDYGSLLNPPYEPSISKSPLLNVSDLHDLLTKIGLERYIKAFQEQEVDLHTFVALNDDELKSLGVATIGARKRMIMAMREYQALQGSQRSSSPYLSTEFLMHGLPIDIAGSSSRW